MKTSLLIVVISCMNGALSASKKEEELPKDVLCAGCEATVKEISKRLSYSSKESLEKKVPKILRSICDEENYKDTENNPTKVRRACKQFLKKQTTDITTALVNYYSKKKQSRSYLDLVKKICSETTGLCDSLTEEGKSEEGRVIFNDETQEFEVIMGKNVRIPHAVNDEKPKESAQKNRMDDRMLHVDEVKPPKPVMSSHDEL